jgi:hypothetical protein
MDLNSDPTDLLLATLISQEQLLIDDVEGLFERVEAELELVFALEHWPETDFVLVNFVFYYYQVSRSH